MQIDPSDIKEARPLPPHSIQLTLKTKKTLVVSVKDWINADSLHQTLLDPAVFIKGYKSASGGIEWGHGPYLSLDTLAARATEQSSATVKKES